MGPSKESVLFSKSSLGTNYKRSREKGKSNPFRHYIDCFGSERGLVSKTQFFYDWLRGNNGEGDRN
jgi:hypothetical protein